MQAFVKVGLRQKALFIPAAERQQDCTGLNEHTSVFISNLARAGYTPSEALLCTLRGTSAACQQAAWQVMREVLGFDKNWTPLVKGWDQPTGESFADHVLTFFTNLFGGGGTRLACGHVIPPHTFPLERYNGCPFCGMPFEKGEMEHYKQGSSLKVLELWTEDDAQQHLLSLLGSKTALDATQQDSLKLLLSVLPLPDVSIGMKETVMTVVDALVEQGKAEAAASYFTTPGDILRYLWFKHTGFLQVIQPKVLVRRMAKNHRHLCQPLDQSAAARLLGAAQLKLKYDRRQSRMVAGWINGLSLEAATICELMHPRRNMWVRFIRALRLAEYSKRPGFEKLRDVLDRFYREAYTVWQGRVDHYRLRYDATATFALLQQRPGLFTRSLFANMLWFGGVPATAAFAQVIDKVPARLVLTLNMYAATYFDKTAQRVVKPLGGVSKRVAAHPLLAHYDEEQLEAMQQAVKALSLQAVHARFAAIATGSRTVYIEPVLYQVPLSIGDRSEQVQDLEAALAGTRFAVQGDTVRLFMQWGAGLPAQHLDMDLSCIVAYEASTDLCSYMNLVTTGCKHSGDIRAIPHLVGTAEYIDIDLAVLRKAGARYATFCCNAYSNGSITPNLVVGWMNSRYPMKISPASGVAYDPSCVQHQVRITRGLTKGLVFGVLDVARGEITWLEQPFDGQVAQQMDTRAVQLLMRKLESKLTIGQLLEVKAKAQQLEVVNTAEADEVYTARWAMDTAGVTALLVD